MNLSLRFDIPEVNGEARGKISALSADGEQLVHADRGDFYSSITRGRYCRSVADKAYPTPVRLEGEAEDAFAARVAEAERSRVAAVDEADRLIMSFLRQREVEREEEQQELLRQQSTATDAPSEEDLPRQPTYFLDEFGGISRRTYTAQGDEAVMPLTNFSARIVQDVRRDDGVEVEHAFAIEAMVRGLKPSVFTIPARTFNTLAWATENLGARAIVFAGQSVRDHARVAIQTLSGAPPQRTVFTHLGWREIEGQWAYLSAGGAIGANGMVDGVEVDLAGPLASFHLPVPPEGAALQEAVRASLRLLDLAKPSIVFPLVAAIWRGILGGCDSSLHLAGASGVFKSELAALVQQHFGPAMTARKLPASWVSTDNALEATCSAAKDAVLVIDEFLPRGTQSDVQALHRKADRILRGVGNHAGRGRMQSDGRLRPHRPPRCVVLSTGEDSPSGQSLKARMLILELAKGDIEPAALAACQADAAAGLYAQATAGFVRWLAPQYAQIRDGMREELAKLRLKATQRHQSHARTPDIVANLAYGIRLFLRFAADCQVLTAADAKSVLSASWIAISAAADAQAAHQLADEPATRFVQLLGAAIASGGAHLASPDGNAPAAPEAWGWRRRDFGSYNRGEWEPRGDRVGWVDGEEVCLEPDAALKAAQAVAGQNGLAVSCTTLRRRLAEKNLIVVVAQRQELLVRRSLQGQSRRVMVLKPGVLNPPDLTASVEEEENDHVQAL